LVFDHVADHFCKDAFCSVIKKHKTFATNLADILIGILCIKVPKIRTLCGGTGPSMAKLREWAVFDVDSVKEYSRSSVDGVRALLVVIKGEFIKMSFDTFKAVKDMVVLFVTGKGSSIAREQIDRVTHELQDLVEIAGVHGPDHLRAFVGFCEKFLNTFAETLTLTPKSSPDERSRCVAALKWLQTNWPLAEHNESAAAGLDSKDVQDAVAKEADRIEKSMEGAMQTSLTTVKKHIKGCAKLLYGVDVEKEAAFRKHMVASAPKLAAAVSKLKVASDQVKVAYGNQGLSFAEKHGELSGEVAETDAMCMYHIIVYAAMTLYRDAQTWAKGPAAAQALANLKQAVTALNNAPAGVGALEFKYKHQFVADMRAELKMPRPSTEEETVSGQSVSTSSESVSDQVVTGSASQASDQPALDDAASEPPPPGRGQKRRIALVAGPKSKAKGTSKGKQNKMRAVSPPQAAVATVMEAPFDGRSSSSPGELTGEVASTGAMMDADKAAPAAAAAEEGSQDEQGMSDKEKEDGHGQASGPSALMPSRPEE
jgi:hypothetical protein